MSDRRHGWVSIGTEESHQSCLLLGSTCIDTFGGLIGPKDDHVLAGKMDLEANDIRDLFVGGKLEYPPCGLGSAYKP